MVDVPNMVYNHRIKLVGNGSDGHATNLFLKPGIHLTVPSDEPYEVRLLQNDRAFKQIEQLTDIARVVIGHERRDLSGGQMPAEASEPPSVGDFTDVLGVN